MFLQKRLAELPHALLNLESLVLEIAGPRLVSPASELGICKHTPWAVLEIGNGKRQWRGFVVDCADGCGIV